MEAQGKIMPQNPADNDIDSDSASVADVESQVANNVEELVEETESPEIVWYVDQVARPGGLEKLLEHNMPFLCQQTTTPERLITCLESEKVLHDWSRCNSKKSDYDNLRRVYQTVSKKNVPSELLRSWERSGNQHIVGQLMKQEESRIAECRNSLVVSPPLSPPPAEIDHHESTTVNNENPPGIENVAEIPEPATQVKSGEKLKPNWNWTRHVTSCVDLRERKVTFQCHTVVLLVILAMLVVYILLVRLHEKHSLDKEKDEDDFSNLTTTSPSSSWTTGAVRAPRLTWMVDYKASEE